MRKFQRFRSLLFRNLVSYIPLFLMIHLIVYTVFTVLYYKPTPSQLQSPERPFATEYFSATPVACVFPISGQYGQAPLYAFYSLIVGTILFRKHKWLAAAIAASALTYSGVAAIHTWLLFGQNAIISLSRTKTYCQSLQTDTGTWDFLACNGVWDPDEFQSCNVVAVGMLASIPMALWSNTFQSTQSRPILILWMLLVCSSHTFCMLTTTDPNRHYQICPSRITEAPPGNRYLAIENNNMWRERFINISTGLNDTMEQTCIYSCFASAGYIGRTPAEIGVYSISENQNPAVSDPLSRQLAIAFWISYTALAILSIGKIANDDPRTPDGDSEVKLLHGGKSLWYASTGPGPANWRIRIQSVAKVLSVLFSLAHPAYSVFVRIGVPEAESFSSVGQWSVAATMCLTLLAALVSKVAQVYYQRRRAASTSPDEEDQMKDSWGHGVGYAS